MMIGGRVSDRGAGLPGVAVSDGRSVVVTGPDGSFVLDAWASAEHVFISLPAGYRIPADSANRARFYREVSDAATIDFALEHVGSPSEFSFAFVTDMHLDNSREDQFVTETIAGLSALEPAPDFIICGGDISIQGGAQHRFLQHLSLLSVPCFHCIGNHEVMVGETAPKAEYRRLLGPTYYSFNYGRCHFAVLDGTQPEPSRQGWQNVVGCIPDEQLAWLRQDLAVLEAGTPIVVISHIPLMSTYSERRGLHSPTAEPAWEVQNVEQVLAVLADHRVLCVLQGHMHENEHLMVDGIYYLTSGAAAGKWWRGDNPDGSPRGFRIIRIREDRIESEYRCMGIPADSAARHMSVLVSEPEERMGRPVRVDVNVFDGMPGRDRVLVRAGERDWWELAPMAGVLHRWTGYLPVGESDTQVRLTVSLQRAGRELAATSVDLTLAPWSPGH